MYFAGKVVHLGFCICSDGGSSVCLSEEQYNGVRATEGLMTCCTVMSSSRLLTPSVYLLLLEIKMAIDLRWIHDPSLNKELVKIRQNVAQCEGTNDLQS